MFTQSQIDQFHHDGTIIAKNLIKGEELEKLQEAADKVVNKGIENAPEDIPNNEKEKQFIWKGLDGYMLKKDGKHINDGRDLRIWGGRIRDNSAIPGPWDQHYAIFPKGL